MKKEIESGNSILILSEFEKNVVEINEGVKEMVKELKKIQDMMMYEHDDLILRLKELENNL